MPSSGTRPNQYSSGSSTPNCAAAETDSRDSIFPFQLRFFCAFGAVCAVIPQIAAITPYVIWNDALNSCAGANIS